MCSWNNVKLLSVKYNYNILILFFAILIFQTSSSAQESGKFDIQNDDIESMLPPLETIIDSAIANNPTIRSTDLQTRIKEYKLKGDRTLWIKNLGMQTDVRYGTINNFSSNTGDGQIPSLSVMQSNSLNYGVGAFVKIPIYDVINRKNIIRSDQFEIEQAQYLSQSQINELRKIVIVQYNDLILKHRVLKIKSKYAETSKINLQMVEKEFSNGAIQITEYARQSEIAAKTEVEFETARLDFKTSYMIFEEIVGVRFNLFKTISGNYESN
jgi:outer membrane protein TolC